MIGCLGTRVHKQPIIALYFESATVLKFYNLEASICQPKNSDVHRGEAEVNITFEGLTNPDINQKRMRRLLCYMTLSLFS